MNQYEELMNAFDEKVRKLMSEYRLLQQQNKELKAELHKEHESLVKAHGELLELRKKNDHLALANQLAGNSEDRFAAKKQIDKMVREIDKCLALLDE